MDATKVIDIVEDLENVEDLEKVDLSDFLNSEDAIYSSENEKMESAELEEVESEVINLTPLENLEDDVGDVGDVNIKESYRYYKNVSFYKSYRELIDKNPILSREEEEILLLDFKSKIGKEKEEIRSKLINSNLRLVYKEAFFYKKKSNVAVEDLINSGIHGLCIAIDKFDIQKKSRLSTYAFPWIRMMILNEINCYSRDVYVPSNIVNMALRYSKISEKDDEKIMEELGVNEKILKQIKLCVKKNVSIDSIWIDNTTLGDIIPDPNSINPEDEISKLEISEILEKELNKLQPMAIQILKMRYLSGDKVNLLDIGKKFGVTGEYIRQIESKSMKILKKRLEEYSISRGD